MGSNAVATIDPGAIMEQVIAAGDLKNLSPERRAEYVGHVCRSVGLNPFTKPFDLITLNGKLTLYATKGATDQLRSIHNITLRIVDSETIDDVYMVTVEASTADGRTDTDVGAVTRGNLKGDALANALMKAVTKAKRRVTLSICGLGLLDESELGTIPSVQVVDQDTGEITNAPETRQNAPQRTQPTAKTPTPIAEGNKATKGQINRIVALFDELEYPADQRRPTLAQLVSQPDPTKLTKAQADKVVAALEMEADQNRELDAEESEYTPKDGPRELIPVEVIDANEIDWDAAKPEGMSQQDWDELMDPAAAGGGKDWIQ